MTYRRTVRVIYPVSQGHIVLRCGEEGEICLKADKIRDDGNGFTFSVESERPYIYCQPCLVKTDLEHASEGGRSLVVLTDLGPRDIYPHFMSDDQGSITDPLEIRSSIMDRSHIVRVYLPPGYGDNLLKHYPVIYMHDGKNLFFPQDAFLGKDWGLSGTLDMLNAMNAVDKVIAVGIYSGDRDRDYTLRHGWIVEIPHAARGSASANEENSG